MSIHVDLKEERQKKLSEFARARRSNMSACIRYALDKLFEEEEIDPRVEQTLKSILDELFVIPRGYKLRSFYLTLHLLGTRYPEASSRVCWGPSVYISNEERTNREVLEYIISRKSKGVNGKTK